MQLRRLACAAVLVAALGGASGCGDSESKNEYVDQVNATRTELEQTFTKLQGRLTPSSPPAEDRKVFGDYKVAVDKAVGKLRTLEPPGEVKTLHDTLAAQIGRYGQSLDEASREFAKDDPPAVIKAQVDLTTALTAISAEINATVAKMNQELQG